MLKNKETPKIEWYIIPAKVGKIDRAVRLTIWVTGWLAASTLAGYAGYQAAAHDPEISNLIVAAWSRFTHGISQTMSDVSTATKVLLENPNLLSEINGETVSREIIDMGSKLYEYVEWNATAAAGNFIRKPAETFIWSFGTAWIVKFLWNIWVKWLIWRENPDFNQRLRSRIWNSFKPTRRSRKIEIPKEWGSVFKRL